MATNLRLSPEQEEALRAESARSGRSQQDILRAALDAYLGRAVEPDLSADAIARRRARLIPPKRPYARATIRIPLPEGMSAVDLIDREDRI